MSTCDCGSRPTNPLRITTVDWYGTGTCCGPVTGAVVLPVGGNGAADTTYLLRFRYGLTLHHRIQDIGIPEGDTDNKGHGRANRGAIPTGLLDSPNVTDNTQG